MSKLGQVIYLTHHKYLCDIARSVCPSVHINDMQSVLVQVADMPALHSFQIVDDGDDLSNATAINSSLASGARLLGNTIIQLLVPEDRRARVMSYTMTFFGAAAFGSLLAGVLAY